MPSPITIPRAVQRDEPWANGAGTTAVILREPDDAGWRVRISVAQVNDEGPFSELPATRRLLVPLDAPMTLRFADDSERRSARFGVLRFDGSPAPIGLLPDGPTRDFNLMLRDGANGDLWPRTLVDSMLLPHAEGDRWLLYVASGHAELRTENAPILALGAGDAALLTGTREPADHHAIRGAGDIILVRLYA